MNVHRAVDGRCVRCGCTDLTMGLYSRGDFDPQCSGYPGDHLEPVAKDEEVLDLACPTCGWLAGPPFDVSDSCTLCGARLELRPEAA